MAGTCVGGDSGKKARAEGEDAGRSQVMWGNGKNAGLNAQRSRKPLKDYKERSVYQGQSEF